MVMKKKIDGHIYNTETAELICKAPRYYGSLYRKYRSNQYFILSGNGNTITPVDWKKAKEIAHENAPYTLYLNRFTSRTNEDGRSNIDISKRDLNMLKAIAGNHNKSNREMLHIILNREYRKLDRHLTEM